MEAIWFDSAALFLKNPGIHSRSRGRDGLVGMGLGVGDGVGGNTSCKSCECSECICSMIKSATIIKSTKVFIFF